MKVMKFGGSTIRNPKMMDEVANIIKNEPEKKVVVVSALYGQTNEIRQYLKRIRQEEEKIDSFIGKIRNRHELLAQQVIIKKDIQDEVLRSLNYHLIKLERLLYGVAYTEELTPRTSDLILSSAERMSAKIIAGALQEHGVHAKSHEADKIGIITDGVFANASADLLKTEKNLKKTVNPEIKSGSVPVITGFFGCDLEGSCTTFGKNGSDYSAAVIASCLNAKTLELWKDVDGFMSADPKMVTNSHTIDTLSYDEAAELAYFGMSLLHPRTVGPAKQKGIPIIIKNIKKPEKDGTVIQKNGNPSKSIIKSVVYSNNLVEIIVSGTGGGYRPGILSEVTSRLGNSNINIYSVTTSQTHLALLIHKDDLKKSKKILSEIRKGVIEHVDFISDIALVCIVGEGAREKKGLAAGIFYAASQAGVNVMSISAGASSVSSHFIIKRKDLRKTILAIHKTFCRI
jgi:aspartate kinase